MELGKVILIVLDSLGIGAAEDADKFGDSGADTLGHILKANRTLKLPNLGKLGIFEILNDGEISAGYRGEVLGAFGKCQELSNGKDTTTGHWEMMGIYSKIPFKTYPKGFPTEFIKIFEKEIGRQVLGNYPASGTEIIEVLGDEHEATGNPIIYTSADSVLQIAVNVDVVSIEKLYSMCEVARKLLVGDWACARVIARPYKKIDGKRVRTSDRKDYSVDPPKATILDLLKDAGIKVVGIGKIGDIFNYKGLHESIHTTGNMDGIMTTIKEIQKKESSFIFTNLVDFDSKYGHRRDVSGYGMALKEFDDRLPDIISAMDNKDVLIITADHGNDPTFRGTDHTREMVPLLCYSKHMEKKKNLGVKEGFSHIGATIADYYGISVPGNMGSSFLKEIY